MRKCKQIKLMEKELGRGGENDAAAAGDKKRGQTGPQTAFGGGGGEHYEPEHCAESGRHTERLLVQVISIFYADIVGDFPMFSYAYTGFLIQ